VACQPGGLRSAVPATLLRVTEKEAQRLAWRVGRRVRDENLTVAVAESLTCGLAVSALGAAEGASEWLRGGVVAYTTDVKQRVLGVSPGPVVSARCAEEMAAGVALLLEADVAVSMTGVGGPDAEEGREPGTVYIGWWFRGEGGSKKFNLEGSPGQILQATVTAALTDLLHVIDGR
jgi:nicotinamide-nucleotide amidase